ncbi:MAG: PQQ-binding-like beta-propeller repeat protein [Armatimonadia bacterium]
MIRRDSHNRVVRASRPLCWLGDRRWSRLGPCLLALLFVAGLGWAADRNWPSFRGNQSLTGSTGAAFTDKPRLRWTYRAGASIEANAAIAGDTVYLATRGKTVLALNLANGKLKWRFGGGDYFTASPCVVGETVYVGDENGTFWALNAATGRPRWKYRTSDKIISSATPAPGAVLFGSYDNYLYKLNAQTGKKIWSFKSGAQVHTTPCVFGNSVAIAGCDGYVRVISLQTGKQTAAAHFDTNFGASPAQDRGLLFVGSMSGDYAAVRTSGAVLWQTVVGKSSGGASFGSPAASGSYVVFPSRNNSVFCLDRATGATRWRFNVKGEADSSPAIAGNRVFFGADDGNFYGVTLDGGRLVWRFRAGPRVAAGPAIGQGKMVISASDGTVYCFGR